MRKCLGITGPFVPTNEPMTLLSYKYLRNLDMNFDILYQEYSIDNSLNEKLSKDKKFNKFNLIKMGDYNKSLFSIKNINLFKALLNMQRYLKKCYAYFNSDKYDFIYTSSFPAYTHRVGKKIKNNNPNVKWIASFSDPINESPYKKDKRTYDEYSIAEKLAFKTYIHFYVNDNDERIALENADILVFICEEQRDFTIYQYLEKYDKLDKYELLNKSVIFPLNYISEWNDIPQLEIVSANEEKKFVMSHFGRVYGLRDATQFIYAVNSLIIEEPSLRNKILIKQFGEFRKSDVKLIEKLGLNEIFLIFNKIPYDKCIQEMSYANVLLIFDTILNDNEIQPYLPSKIVEYSLLEKNVLTITSLRSPLYRIANKTSALCATNNISDIKYKLKLILNGTISLLDYKFTNEEASIELVKKINTLSKGV